MLFGVISFLFFVVGLCSLPQAIASKPPKEFVNPYVSRTTRKITSKYSWELDADSMRKEGAKTFPIPPNTLIEKAKKFVDAEFGAKNPDVLAESFVFQFPIIGPLKKDEFVRIFRSFKLRDIFPDAFVGACDFRTDPYEANRVWFTTYFQGTNSQDSAIVKATNKVIRTPPQSNAVIFDRDGRVVKYIGGYVVDKEWGNTGGLGGVFGLFYGLGKPLPFPEAKPWSPSLQFRLFNWFGSVASKFRKE